MNQFFLLALLTFRQCFVELSSVQPSRSSLVRIMRPAFARASFRAASSFASRTSIRNGPAASSRSCSTTSAPNDPVVKPATAQSISATDAIKAPNAAPSPTSEEDLRLNLAAASHAPDDPTTSETPNDSSVPSEPVHDHADTPDLGFKPAAEPADPLVSDPTVSAAALSLSETLRSRSSENDESNHNESPSLSDTLSHGTDESDGHSSLHDQSHSSHPGPPDSAHELLKDLRGFLRRNAVRSALYHYISALKMTNAPAIDEAVLKIVLPVLGRYGWAPTALDSINLALSREYNIEVGFYNCALHAMARSGDYDTILNIIDKMWALPLTSRPNATSYNYLIGSYMYRGAVDRGFEVLEDMKKHMIYPTFATYHALITGCLRSNDPRRAFTTLTAVERQRFDIGAMTITQVLVACADSDLAEESMQLLPRLEEALPRYGLELNRIAERRNAYRMSSDARTTPDERAVVRGSPKLELGAISSILHSGFRLARADLAISGWSLLRKYYPDMAPSPTLWYCLIGALASSGDFEKAFQALGKMRESGIPTRMRDLESSLVRPLSSDVTKIDEQYFRLCDIAKGLKAGSSAAGSGNGTVAEEGQGAKAAFDAEATSEEKVETEMDIEAQVEAQVTAGLNVESETNDHGIADISTEMSAEETRAWEQVGRGEVVENTDVIENLSLRDVLAEKDALKAMNAEWTDMSPKGVGIDEVNCIIAACSLAGDLDRAFQTYDEVESTFGLTKNTDTYNALLEGCIQVKHVRGGMRIMSEIEKVGLKITGETVLLMVRLLSRGARAPESVPLLRKVKAEGGDIPLQAYLLLIRYFSRGDSLKQAVEVYNMGIEEGHSPRVLKGRIDYEGVKKLEAALELAGGDPEKASGFVKRILVEGKMDEVETEEFTNHLWELREEDEKKRK